MLTVPLLIYGLGLPVKEAIAASLWIVAVVSLIAATQQRAWRVLQPKLLGFFGLGGIIGGAAGAWIGAWINPVLQQTLFALLLFIVGAWMSRVKLSEQPINNPCPCGLALIYGIGLGIVTGLLGVGGGFLMVPVLVLLGISHMPTAVAHSLVLITFNAVVSGSIYLDHIALSGSLMLTIILLAALGSLVGSLLLKILAKERLQRGFSTALAILGIAMLGQLLITALAK